MLTIVFTRLLLPIMRVGSIVTVVVILFAAHAYLFFDYSLKQSIYTNKFCQGGSIIVA